MRLRMLLAASVLAFPALVQAQAPTLAPAYVGPYSVVNLGKLPAPIPDLYSGVCFASMNTILVAGDSNNPTAQIFQVNVIRNAAGHITGFVPGPTVFKNAPNIDGGPQEGPGGVMFSCTFANNKMLQWKPTGGLNPDKTIDLTLLGVSSSTGGVVFVPPGYPGAGGMRITSFSASEFYIATFTPDGVGTYNVGPITKVATMAGGPVDFVYLRPGAPVFNPANQYMLVSEWSNDTISSYQLDASGYPILATRTKFMDIGGPTGAQFDPWTGDYIFTTWVGGSSTVARVSGAPPFNPPASPSGPGSNGEGTFNGIRVSLPHGPEGSYGMGGGMALAPAPGPLTVQQKLNAMRTRFNMTIPEEPIVRTARLIGPLASILAPEGSRGPANYVVFNHGHRTESDVVLDTPAGSDASWLLVVASLVGAASAGVVWQQISKQ